MKMSASGAVRRGFTLIEMLIVIVVIAILALIVIPRLMSAGRKAKEATLRANLQELRNAIGQFEADCGVYPTNLNDLVAASETNLATTGVPANSYKGPYLTIGGGVAGSGLPLNPFGPVNSTTANITDHWTLNGGTVNSAIAGTTLEGIPYSQL
ncbi:MAG: type II secretion system protein [Armatimonadota bacterium]